MVKVGPSNQFDVGKEKEKKGDIQVIKQPQPKLVQYLAVGTFSPGGYQVFNKNVGIKDLENITSYLIQYTEQLKASVKLKDSEASQEILNGLTGATKGDISEGKSGDSNEIPAT